MSREHLVVKLVASAAGCEPKSAAFVAHHVKRLRDSAVSAAAAEARGAVKERERVLERCRRLAEVAQRQGLNDWFNAIQAIIETVTETEGAQ